MDWGDGGGFINDSIAEDPQQITSSVSVASGDDRNKLIAAVSVSQVAKFTRPNEGLVIHTKKIYHVNLVAYVYEIIDANTTKIHLLVDDHSGCGPLEVSHIIGDTGSPGEDPSLSMFDDHMSVNDVDGPRPLQSIRTGDYIRIIGVVKYNQDKANIVAYNLRIIDDPNEITMHVMEVIRDNLYYQKLLASGGSLPMAAKGESKPLGQNTNMNHMAMDSSGMGQLSTRDKHLLNFLRLKAKGDGMHIDEITKNFTGLNRDEILKALTQLSQEGHCWTGEDENVWCVD